MVRLIKLAYVYSYRSKNLTVCFLATCFLAACCITIASANKSYASPLSDVVQDYQVFVSETGDATITQEKLDQWSQDLQQQIFTTMKDSNPQQLRQLLLTTAVPIIAKLQQSGESTGDVGQMETLVVVASQALSEAVLQIKAMYQGSLKDQPKKLSMAILPWQSKAPRPKTYIANEIVNRGLVKRLTPAELLAIDSSLLELTFNNEIKINYLTDMKPLEMIVTDDRGIFMPPLKHGISAHILKLFESQSEIIGRPTQEFNTSTFPVGLIINIDLTATQAKVQIQALVGLRDLTIPLEVENEDVRLNRVEIEKFDFDDAPSALLSIEQNISEEKVLPPQVIVRFSSFDRMEFAKGKTEFLLEPLSWRQVQESWIPMPSLRGVAKLNLGFINQMLDRFNLNSLHELDASFFIKEMTIDPVKQQITAMDVTVKTFIPANMGTEDINQQFTDAFNEQIQAKLSTASDTPESLQKILSEVKQVEEEFEIPSVSDLLESIYPPAPPVN